MAIPIENLYYLLCYAWNRLDESERVRVDFEHTTNLLDLFAKVLIGATQVLLRRGIDRNYVVNTEEIHGIKGKLDLSQTLKRNSLARQKAHCIFDEFSSDILSNQIVYSTIDRLVVTDGLNTGLRGRLLSLKRLLSGITRIEMNASTFKQVRLNRSNRFYGFILDVCRIIYECTVPMKDTGRYTFRDFSRDEQKMNKLFEDFLRNFYRIEQSEFPDVRRETINWQMVSVDSTSRDFLPQMHTDITLENDEHKIIIDAKYYTSTMAEYFDSKKIHSQNLYQLFSYLMHQHGSSPRSETTTGVLLYPQVDQSYDLEYEYGDHRLKIRTVDLNSDWRAIERRLLEIIGVHSR